RRTSARSPGCATRSAPGRSPTARPAERLARARAVGQSARVIKSGPQLPEVPFRSVPEMVAARAAVEPGRAAVRSRTASVKWSDLKWADVDARRRSIAAGLAGLGVKRGDAVAVVSHNSAEMLVAELAAQTLGAAVAPIFPGYSAPVLHHCLTDSGARV